jgi:release factor glutamine methyltransferase
MTVRDLLAEGAGRLTGLPGADPALEAGVLLRRFAHLTQLEVLAYPERPVPAAFVRSFRARIEARRRRVPLAYILGEREFWSIPMTVGPAVLIPRPETELLVETVLDLVDVPAPVVVDIGTGSGCLAVALAKELPEARLVAADLSAAALRVARANAVRHGAANIVFARGDLYRALAGLGLERRVDIIVSNPPYVPAGQWAELEPEVRDHEPRRALVPGRTGLEVLARLVEGAPGFLRPGGRLVLEFGHGQAASVAVMFDERWGEFVQRADLRGIPRAAAARLIS